MHIVIASAFQYPDGGPGAARTISLAVGLASLGHTVTFVLLNQGPDTLPIQTMASVRWVSVAGVDRVSALRWRLRARRRLGPTLDRLGAELPIDALMMADRDPLLMDGGIRIAKSRDITVLHELTEFPDVVARRGLAGRLSTTALTHRLLPCLDGVLVISSALDNYVRNLGDVPTLVTGPIVDGHANPAFPPLPYEGQLILGYAGSLSEPKDGVITLLKGLRLSLDDRPSQDVRLEVLGNTRTPDGVHVLEETERLGLLDHVTFHGLVPHQNVRQHLARCHALVLPRPISRQAEGGFPTKLGEYLATGRPVVTTRVGDISRYLIDNETCVMIEPGDPTALAKAFEVISSDYAAAARLGEAGRRLVDGSFSTEAQSGRIVDFVRELATRR